MKLHEITKEQYPFLEDDLGSIKVPETARIADLTGCPQTVKRNFFCNDVGLHSFKGGPKSIGGKAQFIDNHLSSMQYAPEYIKGYISIENNDFTNLHDIHKHVKFIGSSFFCGGNDIGSHVLGLCLIQGLKHVILDAHDVADIMNDVFQDTKDPSERLLLVQDQLIEAGYEKYAKL